MSNNNNNNNNKYKKKLKFLDYLEFCLFVSSKNLKN